MKFHLGQIPLCVGIVMMLILSGCSREAEIEKWKSDLATGNRDVKLAAVAHLGNHRIVEPILSAVKDQYWEVRVAAARELKNIGDSRAALPLIEALGDRSYAVREAAANALIDFKDERAIPKLVPLLRDDEGMVSTWTADALAAIGAPSVDALIKALGEFDEQDAERVVQILKNIGTPSVDKLAGAIPAADDAGRKRLVDALTQTLAVLQSPSTSINLLAHSDPDVRRAAAISLGEIKDPSSINALIAALKESQPLVRLAAVEALGKIGDVQSLPALFQALKSDPDEKVRREVASQLAVFKDPSVVDPLIRALNDGAACEAAVESLGKIRDPRAVEPLIKIVKNADSHLRELLPALHRESLEALVKIGGPASCAPLFEVLKGPYPEVRRSVAQALSQMTCPEFSAYVDKAIAARQLRALADLYPGLLGRRRDESVPLLLEVFRKYADIQMAKDFLSSGSAALDEAARKWAKARGYQILPIYR